MKPSHIGWIGLLLSHIAGCSPGPTSASGPATGGQLSASGGGASASDAAGGDATGGDAAGGGPSGAGGEQLSSGGTGLGSGGDETMGSGGGTPIETLEDGSPLLLSQTGLYASDMTTLAPGVRPFEPRFALWSDQATKRRWIWLPDGEQIDTTDMDYWVFPTGTRVFKEFNRSGVRVETRMMTKRERGGWQRVAYMWRIDQNEADAVVEGVENASGTDHDIPSQEDCGTCHFRTPDKVLGFSALQLAWDNPDPEAWSLTKLVEAGKLTTAPPSLVLPGDDTAKAALGYMHANCGHCHNPQSSVTTRVTVSFWLSTSLLGSVEETPTYTSAVCRPIELEEGSVEGVDLIIDPGSTQTSAVYRRMDTRGEQFSMPPLGTELVDTTGRDAIGAWIQALSATSCSQ